MTIEEIDKRIEELVDEKLKLQSRIDEINATIGPMLDMSWDHWTTKQREDYVAAH